MWFHSDIAAAFENLATPPALSPLSI